MAPRRGVDPVNELKAPVAGIQANDADEYDRDERPVLRVDEQRGHHACWQERAGNVRASRSPDRAGYGRDSRATGGEDGVRERDQ